MTTKEFTNTREIAETLPQLMTKIDQYGRQASELYEMLFRSEEMKLNGGRQIEIAYKLSGTLLSMATLTQILVERMTSGALNQLAEKLNLALGNPPANSDAEKNPTIKFNMPSTKE